MSRHEGVSCDSCLKGNFRGRRYKCLVCYDYDLCATCYEAGATTTRHTTDHPVQCILTRSDFDMYYGGEALAVEQPQSFTCPYCCKMGITESSLHDHVTSEHTDVSIEIVCPICASTPGGDPNLVTDDFASHLSLDHYRPRDFDEPPGLRHVRRIPHPGRGGGCRTRRGNMHFGSSTNTLTGLSPSGRENMDPIADVREWMPELLSQLSSVRNRAAAAQSVSSQLQQLEMQLQTTRQQLERMPRRQAEANKAPASNTANSAIANPDSVMASSQNSNTSESQFLLAKVKEESTSSGGFSGNEPERLDRNMFVQELLLSTLTEQLQLASHSDDPFLILESLQSPEPEVKRESTSSTDSVMDGSGNVKTKVAGIGASFASSSRDVVGRGGKNVVSESHSQGRNKGSMSTTVGTAAAKPLTSVTTIPNSSPGRPLSGLSSPTGPNVQVEGRSVLVGAAASAPGLTSPPSPHSLLSRASLLAAVPPPTSPPHSHGSTVNLNEHAMGLTPRPASVGMSARDASRLNPAAAKRSMLNHLPVSRGSRDMDPPPH